MSPYPVEFHRYRVTVDVPTPREDWLSRLFEAREGCSNCRNPLPHPPITVTTENVDPTPDRLCSWSCLLELAASVVAIADEPERPLVSVSEVSDWRDWQPVEEKTQ